VFGRGCYFVIVHHPLKPPVPQNFQADKDWDFPQTALASCAPWESHSAASILRSFSQGRLRLSVFTGDQCWAAVELRLSTTPSQLLV